MVTSPEKGRYLIKVFLFDRFLLSFFGVPRELPD